MYNPYDGFNPPKTDRSHNYEQLCCPAFNDAEERRFIAGDPCQNLGTYVMKIETTVEWVHPFTFSEYHKQCSLRRYEHPSYGGVKDKLHGPFIKSNDQVPVVRASSTRSKMKRANLMGSVLHRPHTSSGYLSPQVIMALPATMAIVIMRRKGTSLLPIPLRGRRTCS
ncbi:hypothetical protein NL676_020258 [Syzygium grande]|nr:hypothetical protein NL676_020258 [Syzygium grande]